MGTTKTVEQYLNNCSQWQEEVTTLCRLMRQTELDESIKWGVPYYTYNGHHVVGIVSFKSYFGFWFTQGAQIADTEGVLINAQTGKTKDQRQWRMTDKSQIKPKLIKQYIDEAVRYAKRQDSD